MSGRVYKVPINNLTMTSSGKVDLWDITCGSSVPIYLEEIRLDPIATAVSEYALAVTRWSTFTAATGGTSITPRLVVDNDANAITLSQVLTTSVMTATTTSTAVTTAPQVLDAGAWNLVNGWSWQPIDPDHRILLSPTQALSVQMQTTTATSALISGCLTFREIT